MAKRLFEHNDAWESIASRCANEITIVLKEVLGKLETELEDTVDLRDFHYVANHAIGGFVSDLSITRRLGSGDEQPREIMKHYPRLSTPDPYRHNWYCEDSPSSHCAYDDEVDPMNDHCIYCGDPYERK